jgi:hypothetical protein
MRETANLLQNDQHRILNNIVRLKRMHMPPATPILDRIAAACGKVTPRLGVPLLNTAK